MIFIKNLINQFLSIFNYKIIKQKKPTKIIEAEKNYLLLMEKIKKISVTSTERQWALIQSVKYVHENHLEGDLVECGVFKGGNLILMKHICEKLKLKKNIYAYDTYSGMTVPTEHDIELDTNIKAKEIMNKSYNNRQKGNNIWCYATLDQVKYNLSKEFSNYDEIKFIKGPVENSLLEEENLPKKISILRLDTDFYSSTKIELEILYPRLIKGGVLIIDDYGSWGGSKKAVDEFFNQKKVWLHYIDKDSRLVIK